MRKYAAMCTVVLMSTTAHAQSFEAQFKEANEAKRIAMCVPILKKFYAFTTLELAAKHRKREDISDAHRTSVNIGYRAELFKLLAEQLNPSVLQSAWEASAQLATMSSDQSSLLTSACITLYNELRKTNKLDLAMEQRAIDKIAKEIASDLTKQ